MRTTPSRARLPPSEVVEAPPPSEDGVHLTVRVIVLTAAAVALVSWLFVAAVHIDDRYLVNQVSGAWMGLARYVNEGILYPPLFDGERYGGTRHMPGQFALYAVVAKAMGGNYLLAGKVLSYTIGLALIALLVVILRRDLKIPIWLVAALVAAVVTTPVGQLATISIRGHALPVILQLVALRIVAHRVDRRAAIAAGLLCALAVMTKTTAVWGAVAALVWLWGRRRASAAAFAAAGTTAFLVAVAVIEFASRGRFSENLLGLSGAAFDEGVAALVLGAPKKLLALSETGAGATSILIPVATAYVVICAMQRQWSVYAMAFVATVPVTLLIMADVGVGHSHLLDLHVMSAVAVGALWSERFAGRVDARVPATIVALAVAWGLAGNYAVSLLDTTRNAWNVASGRSDNPYTISGLERRIRAEGAILFEDPSIPVSLGELPVVLDPFMLLRIGRDDPAAIAALERRLDARAFDLVVLFHRPGVPLKGNEPTWRDIHFGARVVDAIARNYEHDDVIDGYEILTPRER